MDMFKKSQNVHSHLRKFLEIKLGSDSYAFELRQVKEVIPMPKVTPVAGAPSYVVGVVDFRGSVLTLVDIRKKLGIKPLEDTFENGIVIFSHNGKLIGMIIDSLGKVVDISDSSISPVPDTDKFSAYLSGLIQQETGLSLWLNPAAMFEYLLGHDMKLAA